MKEKKPADRGDHCQSQANGKRKRWNSAEKLRIVRLGMEPNVEVSDVCRREGLNPTMCYQWKRTPPGDSAQPGQADFQELAAEPHCHPLGAPRGAPPAHRQGATSLRHFAAPAASAVRPHARAP